MKTETKELAAELRRIAEGILFGRPYLVANQAADRLEELERELAAERALADRLAASLEDCRDDSAELLSEHSWWQDEPRCGYAERYKENAKNITRAVKALAAWKDARNE